MALLVAFAVLAFQVRSFLALFSKFGKITRKNVQN
ncbi:MAG: hypothetical protein KGL39_28770, partial [Patescibacteria group bacterium]|nr:hypothetical protein [Patescibacteria group bacterium]